MAKKTVKTIKVTLVKSATGFDKRQAKIVEALGFKKLGQTRVLPDNDFCLIFVKTNSAFNPSNFYSFL